LLAKFTIATCSTALAKDGDGSNCLIFSYKRHNIQIWKISIHKLWYTNNNQVKYNSIERIENNNSRRTTFRSRSSIPSTQQT
jgi:hypothetical protein